MTARNIPVKVNCFLKKVVWKKKKNQDQYGFEIGHHRFLKFTHFAREPQCDKVFQLSQLNRNNDCSKTIAFRKSISLMIWRIRIQIDFRVSWSNNVTTGNCNAKLLFPVCCSNDFIGNYFFTTLSNNLLRDIEFLYSQRSITLSANVYNYCSWDFRRYIEHFQ